MKYVDPSGEIWHLVIGAVVGGVMNWAFNGAEFTWKGLGHFGVGALAGALGAGIGTGIQTASAGASFWAGFAGSSQGISTILSVGYTSSFWGGFASGAGAGFASGFTIGFGNNLLDGQNFGQALWSGTQSGFWGGLGGGLTAGLGQGINARRDGRTFWRGGTITRTQLAYDYTFDGIPRLSPQGYSCVDDALDNISASAGLRVRGSDVRNNIAPGSSPLRDGINDLDAVREYARQIGGSYSGVSGIDRRTMNHLYHTVGTDKVLMSYSAREMNHVVNIVGAYRQVITYPNGNMKAKIFYNVLDKGAMSVRSARFFVGQSSNFFRIILP